MEDLIESQLSSIKGNAMKGAFYRGFIACRELGYEAINPYRDRRKENGGATFATAFKRTWEKGFDFYKRNILKYYGCQ